MPEKSGKKLKNGFTVWFTGLSGSGKSTLSNLVHHRLKSSGVTNVEVLDGDVVRTHLSKGLGFSKEDRDTNIRRIGWVAQLLTKHGIPNMAAAISPYRDIRDEVRGMVAKTGGKGSFIEVFVDCPVSVCEERDTKGLYAKARKGELKQFTGINDPYEPPLSPELHIKTDRSSPEKCADRVVEYLKSKGLIS